MTTTFRSASFALSSYEARFSRGPVDPATHACTACRYEVETVDSHGHCDECAQAREATDEAEAAADDCPTCEGYGYVRSSNLSPENHCDLDECPDCHGAGTRHPERALTSDEGFTAWTVDRRDAANEQQAREVDAFEAASARGAA